MQRRTLVKPITLLTDACFMRHVISYLSPRPDERGTLIWGPKQGLVHVMAHFSRDLQFSEQSPVGLRADTLSYTREVLTIAEEGSFLCVEAHSHPGRGVASTTPSGRDWRYLGPLQENLRAQIIGLITTGDGIARFYTHCVPFKVIITGNGVTLLHHATYREYIFKIRPLAHEPADAQNQAGASEVTDHEADAVAQPLLRNA